MECTSGLDFVFHMFFPIKYSKSLEEGSFRGRSADFLWMLLIGTVVLGSLCSLGHMHNTFLVTSNMPEANTVNYM